KSLRRKAVNAPILGAILRDLRDATKRRSPITDDPLPSELVKVLRKGLSSARTFLEYGAGQSTRIAVEAGVSCIICVESDAGFAKSLQFDGVHFAIANIGPVYDWGAPRFTRPTPKRIRLRRNYAIAGWNAVDRLGVSPDFV